jgi:phenylalanyl-tRNA synthetase beta chain
MKISLEWLGDYLTWSEKDPQVIAERITRSTAEVEELDIQGKFLDHCCVGEVLTIAKHPSADRLLLVDVKTDNGTKRVVCGGTNVREGMHVAFAHIGSTVKWHGGEVVKLEPVKIRGEKSEGMICAAEELEIEQMFPPEPEDGERPVVDLERYENEKLRVTSSESNSKLRVGQSLREALGQTDTVLHFSNTAITARPDLFSHKGFARECIALGLGKLKKTRNSKLETRNSSKKSEIKVQVECPDLVPRYLAAMLEIDGLGETPDWMKKRLQAIGLRSVNLPVDITNYVMNDVGVPMHSFDAGDIKGTVHMRLTKKGESLTTLDNEKRTLPEHCLVLSDDNGVFDLVGIMGGLRSSTKADTKKIFLHALSLDPVTIRRAIIGAGIRTDAATIYEKGVPPVTTEHGFYRALELFLELVPGAKLVSEVEDKGTNGKANAINISSDNVRATLGIDIPDKDIIKILENLDCIVTSQKSRVTSNTRNSKLETRNFTVTPPLHRLRDLIGPHDLIEEVGRIHGFDKVPSTMPHAPLQVPKRDMRLHKLREELTHSGYWELVPLSFVSPDLLKKSNVSVDEAVKVKNPIGEDTSLLQTCPIPQLLAHAERMLPRSETTLRSFQCANVFDKKGEQLFSLGMLLSTKQETKLVDDPFLMVKGEILDAIAATGQTVEVVAMKKIPAIAHPGRCADIVFRGKSIGEIYEIHPVVRKRFGLPHRAAAATLDLGLLFAAPSPIAMQKELSSFPSISYDVTVKRTAKDVTGKLLEKLRGASTLLESVDVQDIYEGKPLNTGEYNLTLRFVYRAKDRTLTEEEVKKEHGKMITML